MERIIAGMRMDFNTLDVPSLAEFVRIHQLQPYYETLTDGQKKVFIAGLKSAHKALNEPPGIASKRSADRHGKDRG